MLLGKCSGVYLTLIVMYDTIHSYRTEENDLKGILVHHRKFTHGHILCTIKPAFSNLIYNERYYYNEDNQGTVCLYVFDVVQDYISRVGCCKGMSC